MSKARPTLTTDERPEWDRLVLDAINGNLSSTDITSKAHKVMELLEDAQKQGHQWADRIIEEAAFHGLRDFVKGWVRENSVTAYKGHDGSVSSLSTRVGVVRDGSAQQVLFVELTRAELLTHINMLVNQRKGTNHRIEAERRLVKVMDAHPECETVGEALAATGLTLDDVLGQAA